MPWKKIASVALVLQCPVAIGLLRDLDATQPAHAGLLVGAGLVSLFLGVCAFIAGKWI